VVAYLKFLVGLGVGKYEVEPKELFTLFSCSNLVC
jgi:hypothetical protein